MPLSQVLGDETNYENQASKLKSVGIFRVRYGNLTEVELEEMEEIWDREGITTISTWNEFQNVIDSDYRNLDESEYPIKMNEETLSDEFTNSADNIDWTAVRDAIALNIFDGNKSQAGQARGSLHRFTNKMSDGSRILATGPSGTRFGVVTEDTVYYDPTNPAVDLESNHKFYRPVTWLRDESGKPVTISDVDAYLPGALQPTRLTNTEVDRDDIDGVVTAMAALDFLKL